MEFICGAADFSEEQKFNPPKSFDGSGKVVYSDNHAIIFGNTATDSRVNKIFEISIDDTFVFYNPASKELHFSCGSSGLRRLFFTFVGSAFIFSTDLFLLVHQDNRPSFFLGNGCFNNISEVKRGMCGSFSPEGLRFY